MLPTASSPHRSNFKVLSTAWQVCDGADELLLLCPGGAISLPTTWSPMKPTDQYLAVTVTPQSTEFNGVQQLFGATAQNRYSTIVKVRHPQVVVIIWLNSLQI